MLFSAKKDGYLINTNRVLFVYTEVMARRPDMRRATQSEIDEILGAKSPSIVADIPKAPPIAGHIEQTITDKQVEDYATLHGIENNKEAINAFCLERNGQTISKIYSTHNMIREVMKLEK